MDSLITAGRHIPAIAVMRERADRPKPGIHECVDLLDERATALRLEAGSPR
ncbi:hypothetical protein [Streptacidiphilus sp. PAMC 29251]